MHRSSQSYFSKPLLLGFAAIIAGVASLAVAEIRPARTIGPLANAPALTHQPSQAELDYALGIFVQFRDPRPDSATPPAEGHIPVAAASRVRI